ncbi:MAG: S41 family peptidase [Actinobacteria bacterium]|nr:S41 family peptidase [Actinomycetota bacterium]
MRRFNFFQVAIIITIAFVVPITAFSVGYVYGKDNSHELPSIRPDEELDLVERVINIVEDEYVEKVNREKLVQGAAKGVVDSLGDPYSHYLDKKHFEMVEEETRGSYSGIGIYLGMKNSHPVVQSVIDGTPAFKAGLKSGDVILEVDGKKTQGKNVDEVASMIRGEEGTTVTLTLGRVGREGTFKVTLRRAQIKIPNVESKIVEKDVGYVRIRGFNISTSSDVERALTDLKNKGAKGFIIDLRSNPGGLLEQAVYLASLFIEKGKIVSIKYRNKEEEVYNATRISSDGRQLSLFNEPVVILVDGGSASASEIFSGAMKDHKRAILIGEKTFGKGSVQNIVRLPNGDGVLITIAKYYTPSGKSIHMKGIEPDIKVTAPEMFTPGGKDDIQLKRALEEIKKKI